MTMATNITSHGEHIVVILKAGMSPEEIIPPKRISREHLDVHDIALQHYK
jgi:hypothetical protein